MPVKPCPSPDQRDQTIRIGEFEQRIDVSIAQTRVDLPITIAGRDLICQPRFLAFFIASQELGIEPISTEALMHDCSADLSAQKTAVNPTSGGSLDLTGSLPHS